MIVEYSIGTVDTGSTVYRWDVFWGTPTMRECWKWADRQIRRERRGLPQESPPGVIASFEN